VPEASDGPKSADQACSNCGGRSIARGQVLNQNADAGNPYAPPKASLDPRMEDGPWRDGKILVMRQGSALPPRCVKCNEPAELPIQRQTVYWHEPWIYVFAVTCLLVYALVSLVMRRRAILAPGLCRIHRKRRWLGIAMGWGGSMAALVLMFLGGSNDFLPLLWIGGAMLLVAITAGLLLGRVLLPARIDKDLVRLKGCSQGFLDTLPVFHG
jgi:hypothetical protein